MILRVNSFFSLCIGKLSEIFKEWISIDLLLLFLESSLNCWIWIEMTKVWCVVHMMKVSSIISVFYFHAGILWDINEISNGSFLLEIVLNSHIHIECLICFFLTIFDAKYFRLVSSCAHFELDTVFVALSEEKSW